MRVLLVEDDPLLGEGVEEGLKQENYVVDWVTDGHMAEAALVQENEFEAVVLDLGIPKKSGLDVLKTIRKKGITTPVLILTAKDSLDDRVAGLDAGADDYLTKPFSLAELFARLRAISRRHTGRATPKIVYQNIELDPASHSVLVDKKDVKISRREFALLHTLLSNVGKVMSRSRMIDALYGWEEEIDSNALEVHIHHLRKKFGNHLIKTVRGVGYIVPKEEA